MTTTSVTSGTNPSGLSVTSGNTVDVLSGGTIVGATVFSSGSVLVSSGGFDIGSVISAGGNETVLGSATGDSVAGTQLVSAATAVVSNEIILNGGSVDLFLKGAIANSLTVESGGALNISGAATADDTVINGGIIDLESAKAALSGTLTFAGSGTIEFTAVTSSGAGPVVISGFGTGDAIDETLIGSGAALSTTTSGGNTIATVTSGGVTEAFTFAGSIAANLTLGSDGSGGEQITYATSSATVAPTLSAFTAGDLVISISGDGEDNGIYGDNAASPIVLQELTTTGSIVGQLDLPQITTVVNGVTEYAISGEYGSSSEGTLQLSADGQSLVIAGYGITATTFNAGGTAVYGNSALAQSTSVPGTGVTAVPRVIADISFNGSIDTSTALFNVFNTNNPRSVATVNGTTFYISGQGVKGDTTQGLFVAQDGASSATSVNSSEDTRTAEIVNGQLYLSEDSTQGDGGEILSFGTTLPTGAATGTDLTGIDGAITLTAAQENGINDSEVGQSVNLSPENFFFASSTVLYVADGGNPKEGGLGDGGLQKWIYNGTSWNLAYTLTAGLNLVPDTDADGTSGLIGLTGTVVGGSVELFATNETINDLDQTYLYGITDTLSATTAANGESFTVLETAAPDTLIRGVSFAPSEAAVTASNTTISAGSTQSVVQVTSGSVLDILSGGTAVSATIFSGGSATVELGGTDSGSFIAQGGEETVLGTATGDSVGGTQLVSAATAVVNNEIILNGGTVELFLKGAIANSTTVGSGGGLVISGNATANDTVLSGGVIELESAKAVLSGTFVFASAGTVEVLANTSAGFGDLAVISGFGTGDAIDFTAVTSVGAAGSAATLSTTTSGGDTLATVSGGGSVETFLFAGTAIATALTLGSDGNGGEQLTYSAPAPTNPTVSSGSTQSGLTVSAGETLDVLGGGTIVSAMILSGGSVTVEVGGVNSGSTISAGGNELILGSATGDLVAGTQTVSAATAVVSNETVLSGGSVDLFLKGAIGDNLTVNSGGFININGNATTSSTVLNGGTLDLQSPKANFTGSLTFSGSGGLIEETDTTSAGFGDLGVISGFAAGDRIDDTVIGSGATLSTTVSGGNTIATITNGGVSQPFTFAGTTIGADLTLVSDGLGGAEIEFGSSSSTSSTTSSSTSGITSTGIVVSGGTSVEIVSGETFVAGTILSGGSATVDVGGIDSGSIISAGGNETVLGSATGDLVAGTQLVSNATAVVSNETVVNGGSVDLFLKGAIANSLTVDSGGSLNISGNATANNTILSGGVIDLESPKAVLSGTLTFVGAGTIEATAVTSAGFGDLAVISGFGPGDVIDETVISSGATLSTTTSGGNTVATITSGGVSEAFTFAGTTIGTFLSLAGDGNGGEEIAFSASPVTSSTVAGDQTLGLGTNPDDETLTAGGTGDVILGGTGNNTLSVSGANGIVTANGTSTVTASGSNDLIVAISGLTTISASGANVGVLGGSGTFSAVLTGTAATLSAAQSNAMVTVGGSDAVVFGGTGALNVDDTGGNSTIATFASNATISAAGSNALIFGGTGTSDVSVSGSSDTLVGGAGSETVSTSANTLMFGGTGTLNFVGGTGTATIVGAAGGTEQISVGGGGLVFGTGSNNTSTITGGTGGSTIFGGSGSTVDFVSSLAGGVFIAGAGNETLDAAQSSSSNLFAASGATGSTLVMIGGSGADTMIAGTGAATMTGGGGTNAFAFFASGTDGAQDFITDFNANDGLFLVGYASTQSATSLLDAASVTTAGVTLTLSDQTRITFSNLNSVSALEGHILNVG